MLSRKFVLILSGIAALSIGGAALSEDTWTVSTTQPAYIGEEVARGSSNYSIDPEVSWTAPSGGLLQTVFHDHDPKCGKEAGYIKIVQGEETALYPVPTAYFRDGGSCVDPVDNLWASRIFTIETGAVVDGDMGETSSYFYLDYATYTPTSTDTPTPTSTATDTSTPTQTSTETSTSTPTSTATETATPIITPTSTALPTATPTIDIPTSLETGEQPGHFSLLLPFTAAN